MVRRSRFTVIIGLLMMVFLVSACATGTGSSTKYPEKPILVIAPAGAGGGWDLTARTTAKVMSEEKLVNVAMPVENRAGGGGSIALAYVVNDKKADPYTLVVYSPPLLLINLNGTTKHGYRDLTPLAQLYTDYQIIAVKKDSKYQNLKQLLDDLKANPKAITVGGASAPGSMDHLTFMLPAHKYGIAIKEVPYVSFPGGAELTTALLGNSIQVAATGVGEMMGQLEAGTVRALAVTAPKRYTDARLKDIPTLKEAGVDAEFEVWRGIFGPPGMPADAKKVMTDAIAKMVKSKSWKDSEAKYNWQPGYRSAEEFTKFLETQEKLMSELLDKMGLLKKQ